MKTLTSDNLPLFGLDQELKETDFSIAEGAEVLQGKTVIINAAGLLWLYMADDHRKQPAEQIIAKRLYSPDFGLLPISCKKAIVLNSPKLHLLQNKEKLQRVIQGLPMTSKYSPNITELKIERLKQRIKEIDTLFAAI